MVMFDMESYEMGCSKGRKEGQGHVVIETGITCTDANSDGNVVITEDE